MKLSCSLVITKQPTLRIEGSFIISTDAALSLWGTIVFHSNFSASHRPTAHFGFHSNPDGACFIVLLHLQGRAFFILFSAIYRIIFAYEEGDS